MTDAPATPKEAPRRPRRRRVGIASLVALVVLVAVALFLRTQWFSARAGAALRREIAAATGLSVRFGDVSFSFLDFAVKVRDVEVGRDGAPRLARVRTLLVAPTPRELFQGRVHLSRLSVDGAEVDLRFAREGDRVVLANGPVTRGGGGGGPTEPPFRDIDITDLRLHVAHPDLGALDLESVDLDLLYTRNRRLMAGLLAVGGEVRSPRLTAPVHRLEARVVLDRNTDELRVALAQVALGRTTVLVREGTFSPRTHRLALDARAETFVEDVLGVLPRHPDVRGAVAVDVRGSVDLETQAFEAAAAVDVRALALHAPDSTTGEPLRYNLGDEIHLRAEATRERVVVRDLRAVWAGAEVTAPTVTLGLRAPMPLEGDLVVRGLDFPKLMRDVTVTPHTIVRWTLGGALRLRGALDPLRLVFDIPSLDAADLAILTDGWDRPGAVPILRIPRARIDGRMVIDETTIQWQDVHASFAHTRLDARRIRVRTATDPTGRDDEVRVEGVASDHIDLGDLGHILDIPIRGIAQVRAEAHGTGDPLVTGTMRVEGFHFATLPFGTLETAPGTRWRLQSLRLAAAHVVGRHRRSPYELHDAYLDFSRYTLRTGARLTSSRFQAQDFYNMFHFEGDPVFEPYDGSCAVDAQVDYVLGRPGDDRDGVMTVHAALSRGELLAFGERVDDASARVSYEWLRRREGVRGARVSLEDFRGTKGGAPITVTGAMAPGARMHFVASARDVPLASMETLRRSEAPVGGTATVSLTVDGTPEAPRVFSTIALRDLTALNRALGAVDVTVSQVPDGPVSRSPGAAPPAGRITLDTRLLDERLRVHSVLRVPWDATTWRDVTGVTHADHARAWGRAELSGTLATSEAIDLLPWLPPTVVARVGEGARARASFAVTIERARLDDVIHGDGRMVVSELGGRAYGLDASLGPGGPMVLCARRGTWWIAPPEERDGCGPAPAALASGAPLSSASGRAFDLARPLLLGPGGVALWLEGSGVAGATMADPIRLDGRVRAELDLSRVAGIVPSVSWGRGVGVMEARVAWDGEQPDLSGSLELHDATVGVASLPAPVSDLDLDVRLRGSDVVLERARMGYGAATVDASGGRVHLERTRVERVEIPVRVRNLVLSSRDGLPDGLELGADADLRVSRASPDEPSLLSGDVTVTRGRFTRPVYLSLDLAGRIGGGGGAAVAGEGAAEAPYNPANDWLRLDVRVNMPTPFRVANNLVDADIRFGGGRALVITGTNQRYGLLGSVEVPRGVMHLNETDFEIRRARVDFDNPERIAPAFDLLAQTDIRRTTDTAVRSQWRVNLHAYGTPDHVSLDWSAEPSLSLEDIVLLLFFRLTRAEMERVGGTNAAQAVATEVLARGLGLERVIQGTIPFVDEFRPGSTYNYRSGAIEPSLSLGGRITDWLRWSGMTTFASQPLVQGTLDFRGGQSWGVQVFLNNATNQPNTQLPNAGVDVRWRPLR